MALSASTLRASTTLRLGERVLVRCDDGLLGVEYNLFESTDIVLRATDPVTVRETGYITTAREALVRLARLGVTPKHAAEAASALSPDVVNSYARSGALINAASEATHLGACELFDGAIFRAKAQTYEGAWLDLRALAAAVPGAGVPALFQAIHLAAALDEVLPATMVHLSTAHATVERRPGERTHRRVPLEGARDIVERLRRVPPCHERVEIDPQRTRLLIDALVARVRERDSADANPALRAHLAALERALSAAQDDHPAGPLSDPEYREIDRRLTAGHTEGILDRLDALERVRGQSPALRYLRARATLVLGNEPPSSVAPVLSAIANEERCFHEAELVAARAWLAAGEDAYARHFARRLAEDVTARDSERLIALEILDATTTNTPGQTSPPAPLNGLPIITAAPIVEVSPGHGSTLPLQTSPAPKPTPRAVPPGASLPPMASVPPPGPGAPRLPGPPARYEPELVESLSLPLGATEDLLAVGDWPTTVPQARVAMTRLARSLARDYRLWYGSTIRCDVVAVEAMQRHLAQRYANGTLDDPKVVSELQRHGALLSEILARTLGGDWVDIAPSEPGYWAMLVPPSTRCWPIGRVHRFVSMGHRERDLVSYYLDIHARTRR